MTKMLPTLSKSYLAQTRQVFNCQCKIKIPVDCGEDLIDRCFEILEEVDARYNSYQVGSFFHEINRKAGHRVEVDAACAGMILTLKLISTLTHGAFDISCMPLLRCWGFYRKTHHTIPEDDALQAALAHVDFRKIAVDGSRVKIEPGQEIVTGSFIKAYAVEQAAKLLRSEGVGDAIINAGGSTIMAFNDETHPAWTVNIPDPSGASGVIKKRLASRCFSFSARANNQLVIGGRAYGHILDCRTGFPTPTSQVGVITRDAFLGDALSTALFAVAASELDDVVKALRQHFEFEFFRVEENGHQISSACF